MILRKETLKKFGYYPEDLTRWSKKRVLKICNNCREIRAVGYGFYKQNKSKNYQKCEASLGRRKPISIKISDDLLLNIFFHGWLVRSDKQKLVRLRRKRLTTADTELLCETLGSDILNSTDVLKNKIREYLLNRGKTNAFYLLTCILQKHLSIVEDKRKNEKYVYYICDNRNLIRSLFDILGFKYNYYPSRSVVRIISGTFFVNGEWIRI